jgi:hypothetical protein
MNFLPLMDDGLREKYKNNQSYLFLSPFTSSKNPQFLTYILFNPLTLSSWSPRTPLNLLFFILFNKKIMRKLHKSSSLYLPQFQPDRTWLPWKAKSPIYMTSIINLHIKPFNFFYLHIGLIYCLYIHINSNIFFISIPPLKLFLSSNLMLHHLFFSFNFILVSFN